jgi:hypothetical protein
MIADLLIQRPQVLLLGILCFLVALGLLKSLCGSKKISWSMLLATVIILRILYGGFLTALQYGAWKGSDITQQLLIVPLPAQTPLGIFEVLRHFFEKTHGYFAFYSFNHFWLGFLVSITLTSCFMLLLVIWKKVRPLQFKEGDIQAVAFACIIVGWPKVIVLVPLAFFVLTVLEILASYTRIVVPATRLQIAFLMAALFTLFFGNHILNLLNLYTLLAL